MDARHLLPRYGKHAERVVRAKVGPDGERVAGEVRKDTKIVRMDPGQVPGGAVVRHVLISVAQRRSHTGSLQRLNFISGGYLDRVERARLRRQITHVKTAWPVGRLWPRNSAMTCGPAVIRTSYSPVRPSR